MEEQTPGSHRSEDLSYLWSRQYEDYLDWLENQNRPSFDLFKPFRLLGGITLGIAVLSLAIFLIS